MSKLKYLLKRISGLNYKNFFKTIDKVHKKNKKNRFLIFLDIIYCGFKYQAGYSDYYLFDMYLLNSSERKTIITRGINNSIVKKYNNKDYNYIFRNKIVFNQKFSKYINRDWMELKDNNYEKFNAILNKHQELIAKPVDAFCGKGVELIKNTKDNHKLYQELLSNKQILIEEKLVQCDVINELHPYSINTLRVVTLCGKVVAAFIRIGNNKNVVDNFNHYGLAAPINIESGTVDYPAINKHDELFYEHPLTHQEIVGLKIPSWNKVKKFCEDATKVVKEIQYVGWDVCVGKNGLYFVEGNEFPGHDIYQLPPHRTNGIGLLPIFKEAMRGDNNENIHRK